MNVWRNLLELIVFTYHDQRLQHLKPADHAKRMDLCHWVNAHPELLNAKKLSVTTTFTRAGIAKFILM